MRVLAYGVFLHQQLSERKDLLVPKHIHPHIIKTPPPSTQLLLIFYTGDSLPGSDDTDTTDQRIARKKNNEEPQE
jgi:hypothetical protein